MIRRIVLRALIAMSFVAMSTRVARAQSVAAARDGSIVVAHDGIVERYANDLHHLIWRAEGVAHAGAIVIGNDRVSILDPLASRAQIIDLATGAATSIRTGETPIGGAFVGPDLYLLDRDSRMIERVDPAGARATLTLAADPAFLRVANERLFVYSRTAGVIQEITANPFAIARTVAVGAFASDFETDGTTAYTVHPRLGRIEVTDLGTEKPQGQIRVGAVPVDLAFAARGTALTAPNLAVTDPAAKRVWIIEGKQSPTQAFARGFLRGLLGLRTFGVRDMAFETGVDRVIVRDSTWAAYDSSGGTLYRFSEKKTDVLARGVAPGAFAVVPDTIVWWQNGTLQRSMIQRQ